MGERTHNPPRYRVDSGPTDAGGREWVRSVACAHCASDNVSGLDVAATDRSVSVRYRCEDCRGWTGLDAFTHDHGYVYVRRGPRGPGESLRP